MRSPRCCRQSGRDWRRWAGWPWGRSARWSSSAAATTARPRAADRRAMAGHFVVCGLGQVGTSVALLLRRLGESVTAVTLDPREEWLALVRSAGVQVVLGDARRREHLIAAGVADAAALLALTSQDLVNVEV